MAFVKVATNVKKDDPVVLNNGGVEELLKNLSDVVTSAVGRPKQYVMVNISFGENLSTDKTFFPCAFVSVHYVDYSSSSYESTGSIQRSSPVHKNLSKSLATFLQSDMGIKPTRVFAQFFSPEPVEFGWNGKTFAIDDLLDD